MSRPPLKTRERELFLLGSEGVLFCRRSNRLFYLNTTAAFLWCCLEEGLDPTAAAMAISEHFGIPDNIAKKDVETSLANWESQGLLDEVSLRGAEGGLVASTRASTQGIALHDSVVHAIHPDQQDGDWSSAEGRQGGASAGSTQTPHGADSTSAVLKRHYRAGSLLLCICFGSQKSESLVHPILAHLTTEPIVGSEEPSAVFDIGEDGSEFVFSRDGLKLYASLPAAELAPVVQREMLLTAYNLSGCLIAIHAAAFSNGSRSLLMPGIPGSGKSTLTAALIDSGFTYLTDELVLLMPNSYAIRPVRTSLGLKRGSWSLLRPQFPSLEVLPTFRQQDGTEVRYLVPPADISANHPEYAVEALVFPWYVPKGPTGLNELTSAKALYRLAEAGYAVPGGLNSSVVEDLIGWIGRMPCYELGVRDLSEAISELGRLLE